MSHYESAINDASAVSVDASQYLTFCLGDGHYAVDILAVQEIKGYVPTTRIPNTPPEVVGILNLRGTIVPIVDIRRKFDMESVDYTPFTAIVVVVVRNRVMGMIVDSVSEVISIPAADTQQPDALETSMDTRNIQGIAKMSDKLILLLDVEAVLVGSSDQFALAA